MEAIQYVGADTLNSIEKDALDNLSAEYYDKLKRALHNEFSLKVHIKTHEVEKDNPDKAKRFEISAQAIAPTSIFEASAEDWDLPRVLHKVFKDLEFQVEHKLHTDEKKAEFS